MDRTLLETVSLLGLDVVATVVLGLALVHWALEALHRVVSRWLGRRAASRPAAPGRQRPADAGGTHWPPGPWRTSH